jgi:hypothetical protein
MVSLIGTLERPTHQVFHLIDLASEAMRYATLSTNSLASVLVHTCLSEKGNKVGMACPGMKEQRKVKLLGNLQLCSENSAVGIVSWGGLEERTGMLSFASPCPQSVDGRSPVHTPQQPQHVRVQRDWRRSISQSIACIHPLLASKVLRIALGGIQRSSRNLVGLR